MAEQNNKTECTKSAPPREVGFNALVMRFRRLLLMPFAGLFELFLLLVAVVCIIVGRWHKPANVLAGDIIKYANTMPGAEYYLSS